MKAGRQCKAEQAADKCRRNPVFEVWESQTTPEKAMAAVTPQPIRTSFVLRIRTSPSYIIRQDRKPTRKPKRFGTCLCM